jgi:hypothetical protein
MGPPSYMRSVVDRKVITRRIPVLYLVNNDVEWSIYRTHIGLFSNRNNSGTHWNGSGDKIISYYDQEKNS